MRGKPVRTEIGLDILRCGPFTFREVQETWSNGRTRMLGEIVFRFDSTDRMSTLSQGDFSIFHPVRLKPFGMSEMAYYVEAFLDIRLRVLAANRESLGEMEDDLNRLMQLDVRSGEDVSGAARAILAEHGDDSLEAFREHIEYMRRHIASWQWEYEQVERAWRTWKEKCSGNSPENVGG